MNTPVRFAGKIPDEALKPSALKKEADLVAADVARVAREAAEQRLKMIEGNDGSLSVKELLETLHLFTIADADHATNPRIQAAVLLVMKAVALRSQTDWAVGHSNYSYLSSIYSSPAFAPSKEAVYQTALALATGETKELNWSIHRILRQKISQVNALNPAAAETLELSLYAAIPAFSTARRPPGNERHDAPHVRAVYLYMTEQLTQDLLATTTGSRRAHVAKLADLDWLSPADVSDQISSGSLTADRINRFSKATAQDALAIMKACIRSASVINLGADVPGFKALAKSKLILELFDEPLYTKQHGYGHTVRSLLEVADSLPPAQRAEPIAKLMSRAATELLATPADPKLPNHVVCFLHMAVEVAANNATDIVVATVSAMDLSPFFDHDRSESHDQVDLEARRNAKYLGLSNEDTTRIRSALVTAGAIHIGSLRNSDLRAPIIGQALAKNPGRLAEIEDFRLFVETAKKLKINIELPEGVREAFKMSEVMNDVLAANNPLAAADPLNAADEAPKSKRRARP